MRDAELDEMLALEGEVWDALVRGDAQADAALLADSFLGVYETGFGDRAEHVGQLDNGPTVSEWSIREPRLMHLGEGVVLLTYRAVFRRVRSGAATEEMMVSSIWHREGARWLNIFSQDTAVGENRPV